MDACLARQAILDRNQRIAGYEILFRSSPLSMFCDTVDGSQATSRVIEDSLLTLGLDRVLSGKRGFINFTRELLLNGSVTILPPAATVVEILETVPPDQTVILACRDLKARGYVLALDDFVCEDRFEPLVSLADIIKVDFLATPRPEQEQLVRQYARRGIAMLAEKVETGEQYEWARRIGYSYFQGYFFARPVVLSGRKPPAFKLHYQRLLSEIHRPGASRRQLEEIIRQEMSLVFKLLRYVNSARFAFSGHVESIRQALVLLGDDGIRKWASLVILSAMADDKPRELVVLAMIRARLCELIGPLMGLGERTADLFLMGMFSLLDAIMDCRLEETIPELRLNEEVTLTLLHSAPASSRLAKVYELVCAYQKADWNLVSEYAGRLGVTEAAIAPLYVDSVQWAESIFQAA